MCEGEHNYGILQYTLSFVSGWIFRFGIPSTVTIDHGSQFECAFRTQLMQLLGSKRTIYT